jgi:phage terminase large subunit GpA-like protein
MKELVISWDTMETKKKTSSTEISRRTYVEMHSKIKLKLYREAFHEKNSCFNCGSKESLQIHYLVYDPLRWDDPETYRILCKNCHSSIHPRHSLNQVILKPKTKKGE